MRVTCCDICCKPLTNIPYVDRNGKKWRDITFEEHKYSRKIFSFVTSSFEKEYLSVCGYCRSELAKRNPNKWIGE